MPSYYFSLQYSAIQKIVLRHNRLWSIAGISQALARLNEVIFLEISRKHKGKVLVAGGGKLTVRFSSWQQAEAAKNAIIRRMITDFPMLEFQAADIKETNSFQEAKEQGILEELGDKKQQFRGYATSYLPHMAVCQECGEYPAEQTFRIKDKSICRTCRDARQQAEIKFSTLKSSDGLTTLERIYAEYLKQTPEAYQLRPVYNFEDLFGATDRKEQDCKHRLAVWFSDLNNMNQKVPVWLAQGEDDILATFDRVKEVNIHIIAQALTTTFKTPKGRLPFRLIVAGGDDLCLVMPEEFILDFASNLHQAVQKKIKELDSQSDNPLNTEWLQNNAQPDSSGNTPEIGPYSFGSSFVITSLHTPFRHIHEIGETLMKTAKEKSMRLGNSVNWRIMAEDNAVSDHLLPFEKPLFMDSEKAHATVGQTGLKHLSFSEYIELRDKFSKGHNNISSSHRYAIIAKLIELRQQGRQDDFENWLKRYDSGERVKSFSGLLTDNRLREGGSADGQLLPARIVTLFELLGIKRNEGEYNDI